MDEKFPRQVWKLTPSYTPKAITITSSYNSYFGWTGYNVEGGTPIGIDEVWATKDEAIAAGNKKLDKQLAKLDKQLERISKRRAALKKAGKTTHSRAR